MNHLSQCRWIISKKIAISKRYIILINSTLTIVVKLSILDVSQAIVW